MLPSVPGGAASAKDGITPKTFKRIRERISFVDSADRVHDTRKGIDLMARPIPSIEECKRDASLLLKDLKSERVDVAKEAAERFRRIAPFREQTAGEVLDNRDGIQRKHALAVIAREHGYVAWKNLKDAADVLWCPPGSSAFWHNWCKTHEEARKYLQANGGYLLTAHGKWFIAERGYIEHLGLNPDDPRWEAIGFDVYEPKDTAACDGLVADRKAARYRSAERAR
jgi:hypothetical protein